MGTWGGDYDGPTCRPVEELPCPADGLCYDYPITADSTPICCTPMNRIESGIEPHCEVEMDFPGCWSFEDGDWYY